jgi:hypothetical protein
MSVEIERVFGMVYSADQTVEETADPHHRFLCYTVLRNSVCNRVHTV